MDKTPKVELGLIATDYLIDELFKRFEHSVFGGLQIGVGDGTQQQIIRKWIGNTTTCAGLSFSLAHAIMDTHFEQSEPGTLDQ